MNTRLRAALMTVVVLLCAPVAQFAHADVVATLLTGAHGKPEEDVDIRVGGSLEFLVKGAPEIVAENGRARGVVLVLDDVSMTSLDAPLLLQGPSPGSVRLAFRLTRHAENEDSRREWTRLLEKQIGGYRMKLPMALAFDGKPAVRVLLPQPTYVSFTSGACVAWSVVLGLAAFAFLCWLFINSDTMLRDHPHGPYSLGKSQMAFWGLLVAISFVLVLVNTQALEYVPGQVLVLMGISGATGLGAILIGNSTRSAEIARIRAQVAALPAGDPQVAALQTALLALEQPATAASKGFLRDLVDDGHGASFHRVQVVMWTLILGAYFGWSVSQVVAMPVFSDTLLMLMGISNSIYLGFKFPEPA